MHFRPTTMLFATLTLLGCSPGSQPTARQLSPVAPERAVFAAPG